MTHLVNSVFSVQNKIKMSITFSKDICGSIKLVAAIAMAGLSVCLVSRQYRRYNNRLEKEKQSNETISPDSEPEPQAVNQKLPSSSSVSVSHSQNETSCVSSTEKTIASERTENLNHNLKFSAEIALNVTESTESTIQQLEDDSDSIEVDDFQAVTPQDVYSGLVPMEENLEPAELLKDSRETEEQTGEQPAENDQVVEEHDAHISDDISIFVNEEMGSKKMETGCDEHRTHRSDSNHNIESSKGKVIWWLISNKDITPEKISNYGSPITMGDSLGEIGLEPPDREFLTMEALRINRRLLATAPYRKLLSNPNIQRLRQFGGYLNSDEWPKFRKDVDQLKKT